MLIPVFYMYASGGGDKIRNFGPIKFTLGNLGYAESLCFN